MRQAQPMSPPETKPGLHSPGNVMSSGNSDSLRSYTRTKLALAAQLRSLHEVIQRGADQNRLRQCDDLMVKLAEDRFTLAVLGQFKRGKSSLMNAIIGRELLPVGMLPLTSAITLLRYGPKDRLLITRSDVKLPLPQEEPVEKLADFVTEKENPGNCKHVKTAVVELPVPFLRRGLEFVDTPGVGSAIEANTQTTLKFLPECDAVLFVTSVDSPLTRVELEFLESIRQHVRKIFFVVNKMDLLGPDERGEMLDYIRDAIRKGTGAEDAKVFPISARLGLIAKLEGGWSDGIESGLTDLENALARFLSSEKALVFLTAIADRALWLLEQQSIEADLRERATELPEKEQLERLNTLAKKLADLKTEREKIFHSLRERILSEVHLALMPELGAAVRTETKTFSGSVERYLNRVAWLPLASVLHKAEQTAVDSICGDIWNWLQTQSEKLSFGSDETIQQQWRNIQSNLESLTTAAVDVFELSVESEPRSGTDQEPWRLNVTFETPFLTDWRWEPPVSQAMMLLPTFLARSRLKRRLEAQMTAMSEALERAALEFAKSCVSNALDAVEREIEKRAGSISLRIFAAIKTKPNSNSEGRANIADQNDDDSVPAIRERLLGIRREIIPDSATAENERISDASKVVSGKRILPVRVDRSRLAASVSHDFRNEVASSVRAAHGFTCDLKARGCPICNHVSHVAFEFFSQFQYDLARHESAQEEFAEMFGFCALHTWQLETVSSPVGASIGFAKLSEHVSKLLAARAKAPCYHRKIKLIRDFTECHACRLLREKEQEYLHAFAEFMKTSDGHLAYSRSYGVCLRHLGLWLPLLSEADGRFTLEEASRRFEQFSEDMQSFSMKTEALRRQLHNNDERDAYLRAITHLVGARANCQPMNREAAEI